MGEQSRLEAVLEQATTLSPIEKIRLVEEVMATLRHDLTEQPQTPRKPLYGIWSDVRVTEQDIDEARREMWGNFPREDI